MYADVLTCVCVCVCVYVHFYEVSVQLLYSALSLSLCVCVCVCVQWGMLPCGHSVCMDCIVEMTQRRVQHYWQSGTTRLSCPLCRFSCLSSEINAVRPREGDNIMDVKVGM